MTTYRAKKDRYHAAPPPSLTAARRAKLRGGATERLRVALAREVDKQHSVMLALHARYRASLPGAARAYALAEIATEHRRRAKEFDRLAEGEWSFDGFWGAEVLDGTAAFTKEELERNPPD